ncbi:hypothetical protein NEF87_000094 [Candidatus Lokiarchaeum ossiferum]|uniref:Uncharacterized protein n=1 Tax=Candidatus Lokiarchaeum ossiferum TaxID=2951803 RepID=A0ABY6HJV7_9ARCH|nr:hypothetical protein NEF87_000094 [Candidatus Lokiarchaeum sp. B-35]
MKYLPSLELNDYKRFQRPIDWPEIFPENFTVIIIKILESLLRQIHRNYHDSMESKVQFRFLQPLYHKFPPDLWKEQRKKVSFEALEVYGITDGGARYLIQNYLKNHYDEEHILWLIQWQLVDLVRRDQETLWDSQLVYSYQLEILIREVLNELFEALNRTDFCCSIFKSHMAKMGNLLHFEVFFLLIINISAHFFLKLVNSQALITVIT